MTEQEAIKWIDDRMCYGRYTPQKHNPFVRDECCQAGEMAIVALEKQIVKKPKYLPLKEGITLTNYECPICGCRRLGHGIDLDKCYCPECGQKLDWSEV